MHNAAAANTRVFMGIPPGIYRDFSDTGRAGCMTSGLGHAKHAPPSCARKTTFYNTTVLPAARYDAVPRVQCRPRWGILASATLKKTGGKP
jgi:hypothetical protein